MTDYSVYLVTDSSLVPKGHTFLLQIEAAIDNGVTVVQLREKSLDTRAFIERAHAVKQLATKRGVPFIINDRVDVALAVDADGVHVGQDDMHATTVRKLIGPKKILGVTCSFPHEVEEVCKDGVADYVGLGTVFKTTTKEDVKTPEGTGPIGIRKMMDILERHNSLIKTVAIGGINHLNAARVLYQCRVGQRQVNGLAVVSCIMAARDASTATRKLAEIRPEDFFDDRDHGKQRLLTSDGNLPSLSCVRRTLPLVHHITNNVVKNFCANVTLAIGALPIMSELSVEFGEFASSIEKLCLVINLGTPTPALMETFISAIEIYNKHRKPVVFDPVAAGASTARLECCREILNAGQVSAIKGNVGEIMAIYKLTSEYSERADKVLMRGVDSVVELTTEEIIAAGQAVSRDFRCVVVITGKMNYVVQESQSVSVDGGAAIMAQVTGSGCALGSTIGAHLAATSSPSEFYAVTVDAVRVYNQCGKLSLTAAGSGSFVPAFLDALYNYK